MLQSVGSQIVECGLVTEHIRIRAQVREEGLTSAAGRGKTALITESSFRPIHCGLHLPSLHDGLPHTCHCALEVEDIRLDSFS